MKQLPNLDLLKDSLSSTKKALILMSSNPNFDTAAAALGFAGLLRKKGIDAQVVSLADMRVEFSRLVGVDSVRKKVGNRNLVVSFDYSEERVEKVSYQISEEGKRFNLVIAPKAGGSPLSPESVEFELAGAEAEFIACFGIDANEELEALIKNEHGLMDGAMSVAFTLFPVPPFVKVHLDAQGLSSLSELTALAAVGLGLEVDEDSGSSLLAGIDYTSGGFRSPMTTADTFETVAQLMRAGARRPPVVTAPPMTPSQMPFIPNLHRPNPLTPPPVQANTNQFAQLLNNTQQQAPPMPPVPSEYKG